MTRHESAVFSAIAGSLFWQPAPGDESAIGYLLAAGLIQPIRQGKLNGYALTPAGYVLWMGQRTVEKNLTLSGIISNYGKEISKTCSGCGQHHPEMILGVDTLRCDCGLVIDRDLNAAINLATYAASSAVSACGEEGSGVASVA